MPKQAAYDKQIQRIALGFALLCTVMAVDLIWLRVQLDKAKASQVIVPKKDTISQACIAKRFSEDAMIWIDRNPLPFGICANAYTGTFGGKKYWIVDLPRKDVKTVTLITEDLESVEVLMMSQEYHERKKP